MPNYKRVRVAGGCYFFTLVTDRRRPILAHPAALRALRMAMVRTRRAHPFRLDAMVVLSDHLHMLLTLPEGDDDYPVRIQAIKALFSRFLPASIRNEAPIPTKSRLLKREAGIWQRRYWEHTIRDEEDFRKHLEYIFFNPLKHHLVVRVADWPHSSFHRYVQARKYPSGWGGGYHDSEVIAHCHGE